MSGSRLLLQPAVWSHLALNPEPRGTAMDADSVERWYQEILHMEPEPVLQAQARIQPMRPAHGYRPSSCLHIPRRR